MRILIFDRKGEKGKKLKKMLERHYPEDRAELFSGEEEILDFAGSNLYRAVFLFIENKEGDLLLGRKLSQMIPFVNLVIISEDEDSMADAIRLHASGYILLPLDEEKLVSEMENLLYPGSGNLPEIRVEKGECISIFVDDMPLNFKYEKTKDLFLLLLDMKGAVISTGSIKEKLWGDSSDPERTGSYLQNLRSDLLHTLDSFGLEGVICHSRGRMWVDRERFFLK